MYRQIIGYVPSTVIPAAVSFLMIYIYTRILTPLEYGNFSLVFAAVMVVQTSFFYAIPLALLRFYPQAVEQGRHEQFLIVCTLLFYSLCGLVLGGIGVVMCCLSRHDTMVWGMAALLLITRSAIALNQSVNRISARMQRYNIIECGHAVLGLTLGLLFVDVVGATANSVLLGLLVAATACMLADLGWLTLPFRRTWQIDRGVVMQLVKFAIPLILVDVAVCLLALSDRFLLEALGGASALGVYTVAYNLVERPTTLICTTITTATFPHAVQILQQQGRHAGGRQLGINATVLLALIIPGCVGLAITAPLISAVMIGEQFRAGVTLLIPILCFTALLRGISTHVIDHAFHLAGRTNLALWVYAPSAAANVVLNILLIRPYGMFGAAWASLTCQALAVLTGWLIARRTFPIQWQAGQVVKVLAAVVPMACVLSVVPLQASWGGLLVAVCLGAVVFGVAAVLLDVCHAREAIVRVVIKPHNRPLTAGPRAAPIDCNIVALLSKLP